MKRIVVTQPMYMSPDHMERLDKLGNVTYYEEIAMTPE